MFNDHFVVYLKCNNQILREKQGIVTLPFNSEYSIVLKNLHTTKAQARIQVDGDYVMDGWVLLNPLEQAELEGFVKGLNTTHKFKFIEKTKQISDFRGDKVDDGIVRVEFQFEKAKPEKKDEEIHHYHYYHYHPRRDPFYSPYIRYSGTTNYDEQYTACFSSSLDMNDIKCNCNYNEVINDEGITVKGSHSNQTFIYGSIGKLEENKHVIILKLRGSQKDNIKVSTPIYSKQKLICPTCGITNTSRNNFCYNCGTALD